MAFAEYQEFGRLAGTAKDFAGLTWTIVTFEWTTDESKDKRLKLTVVSIEDASLKKVERFFGPREARLWLQEQMREG